MNWLVFVSCYSIVGCLWAYLATRHYITNGPVDKNGRTDSSVSLMVFVAGVILWPLSLVAFIRAGKLGSLFE